MSARKVFHYLVIFLDCGGGSLSLNMAALYGIAAKTEQPKVAIILERQIFSFATSCIQRQKSLFSLLNKNHQ